MDPNERQMENIRKRLTNLDPKADPDSIRELAYGHIFMGDVNYRAVFGMTKELPEQMKKYLGGAVLDVKYENDKAIEVFIDNEFAGKREFTDDGTTDFFLFVEYKANGKKKGDLVKLERPAE